MTLRSVRSRGRRLVACAVLALAGSAAAQSPSRGELLYATHCIECHDAQVHWRDKRQARDWPTLKAWVQHWQGEGALRWTPEDVEAVARHLNDTIYHFPRPVAGPVGWR